MNAGRPFDLFYANEGLNVKVKYQRYWTVCFHFQDDVIREMTSKFRNIVVALEVIFFINHSPVLLRFYFRSTIHFHFERSC